MLRDQMHFSSLTCQCHGLLLLILTDAEHPPYTSELSYPASRVQGLFSWKWLYGTAHLFYQCGPFLSEFKSFAFTLLLKKHTHEGSFLSALGTV